MTSLDELPELAPYLPDMDDLEDELDAWARRATAETTPTPRLDRGGSADCGGRAHRRYGRGVIATDDDGLVRLQKLLAQSGVASGASARS